MADASKSKLDSVNDFLKITLWPIVLIVVLIVFGKPIKALIANSDSITIGNLSLKIKNEIPTPSNSIRKILPEMSNEDIRELLYLGSDTSEYNGYSEGALDDVPVESMLRLALIKKVQPPGEDTTKEYYKVTKLGSDTYSFYLDLIKALGRQIDAK